MAGAVGPRCAGTGVDVMGRLRLVRGTHHAGAMTEPAATDLRDGAAGHDLSDAATFHRAEAAAVQGLAAWGLRDASLSLLHLSENATFLVASDGRPARVLRVHRTGYHDDAEIASELAWMDALRRHAGVRTPAAIPAVDGRRVVALANGPSGATRWAVLFEHVEGCHPTFSDADGFAALGALTAHMHRHSQQWRRPRGFVRFAWNAEAAIGASGRWGRWEQAPGVGPAERRLLGRLANRLTARLGDFGCGPERFGLIHADLRPDNLLVDGRPAVAPTVLDFDDCGFGWYLYDLAAAVSFFEDAPVVPALLDAWLAGYRSVSSLAARDEREVWTFILLRRMLLLAWIGSHPGAETARRLGATYAHGSCELSERYLSGALD